MANKKILKRICTDKIIRKGFALLFGLHNIDSSSQMYSCLNQIYQDSSKLKELTDKLENKESIIEKLNNRVLKMFPLIKQGDSKYYNKFYSSIKSANFWYVNSKSYFDTITKTPSLTGSIEDLLKNNSGDFLESGFDLDKHKNRNDIYQPFNEENFRELRVNNKFYLLKEFSKERIQSKFISSNLFSTPDYELKGYLNTLSDVSLIFVQFKPNVFCQGIDIAFNNIIKLLNSSQKIKFIINIDNGLSEPFINHWINYLEQNTNYSGRWVYINTPINLPQFLAGSDLILLPNRTNVCNDLHYLSLYYGCIPVANSNGLYNDTIIDIFDNIAQGNGFKTKINLLREEKADELFAETLKKALQLYNNNSASWNLIIKNAMNYNSSWNFRKIEKFNRLYEKI